MKKIIALMLALIMVFSLAACAGRGDDDDEDEKEEKVEKEEKDEKDEGGEKAEISLDFGSGKPSDDDKDGESEPAETEKGEEPKEPVEVQRPQYLIMTDVYYEPFEFYYEEGGEYVGFDIDIMNLAAKYENFDVEYIGEPYESIFDAMVDGKADAAIAAISKTADREMVFDYSDAYFTDGIAIVVMEASGAHRIEDLQGCSIGCVEGSYSAYILEEEIEEKGYDIDVKAYADYDSMYNELNAGSVEAVADEYSMASWRIYNKGYDMALFSDLLSEQDYYLIVAKGENGELIEMFNSAVDKMKNDTKEYYRIMDDYGFDNFID